MASTESQKRRSQLKAFSWSGAVILAGIVILINFVVSYVPIRLDTSGGNAYSISPGSKALLKKLNDTLLVRIMFSAQLPPNYQLNQKYLTDLLAEYKRASNGKIRIEFFDPSKAPQGREQALAQGVVPVQLDVRERDRREVKECFMGVAFLYGDKKGSIPLVQDSQNLEYEITVQIKRLIDPEKPIIGVGLTGGSLTFDDKALQPLSEAIDPLYTKRPVDLTKPVPADIKALWVIGPYRPVDDGVNENIIHYLKTGGTVGLLLDRHKIIVTEFKCDPLSIAMEPVMEFAGLHLRDGLILDQRCDRIQVRATQGAFQMINIVDYPYIPVVVDINRNHPTTKGIEAFTMAYVSPIEINNPKPGVNYTVLARSSADSYLDEMPIMVNPLQEHYHAPNAPVGPFNLIVTAEGNFDSTASTESKPGRMILFSSSRFINTEFPLKQSNLSLFMNVIDWSVQDDTLLQIRSKGLVQKPLKPLPDGVRVLLKTLFMVTLPILSLVVGFVIWQRQKIRRALLPLQYQEVI